MNELVLIKHNEPITTSIIIAKETKNQHKGIVQLIRKYATEFSKFGLLHFKCTGQKGKKGYKTWYELNEPQATLLMSFLDNNETVVEFKVKLVHDFYRMKQVLLNMKNQQWLQFRDNSKIIRREFTDILEVFVDYAYYQGSKSADKYFMLYTKLVNKTLEIEAKQRDVVGITTLNAISLLENTIGNIIIAEMEKGTYYKDIYKICRDNCAEFIKGMFIKKPALPKAI